MITDSRALYDEMARRLLELDTIAEIQDLVLRTPNLDQQHLLAALDALDDSFHQAGQTARLTLLRYVQEVVENCLPHAVEPDRERSIRTGPDVIELARVEGSAMAASRLLRDNRELLDDDTYHWFHGINTDEGPRAPTAGRDALLLCLLSRLREDRVEYLQSLLMWASVCRINRRLANAARHQKRARLLAGSCADRSLSAIASAAEASTLEDLGEFEQATELYASTWQIADELGDDALRVGVGLTLAGYYRRFGRLAEAVAVVTTAVGATRRMGVRPREASLRELEGLILDDLGRYDEAQAAYGQAQQLAQRDGNRQRQFAAMNNAAASLLKRGDAVAGVRKFRDIARTVEGWGNPIAIASSQNNLGSALLQLGQSEQALSAYRSALSTTVAAGPGWGEVTSYLGIGDALQNLARDEDARVFYQLALSSALAVFDHTGEATLLAVCASRLVRSGDVNSEQLGVLREALDAVRRTGEFDLELELGQMLADHLARAGDSDQAVLLVRGLIEKATQRNSWSPALTRVQIRLARLLTSQPAGVQEAYATLSALLHAVESQVAEALLDERRAEIQSQWFALYSALLDLVIDHGGDLRLAGGVTPAQLGFDLHEAAKSRTFGAALADSVVLPDAVVSAELASRETRLSTLERELQGARDMPLARRLERLREVRRELRECWNAIAQVAPEYVRLRTARPIDWRECQALLASRSGSPAAFVSFYCDEESTTSFVVRSDDGERIQAFRSPIGRTKLEDVARRLRRQFNGDPLEFPAYPPIRRDRPEARPLDFLDEISAGLLAFLPAVQGAELLCVAPHGPLHLLPLHALKMPDGRCLFEQFATNYAPSATTLSVLLQRRDGAPSPEARPRVYAAGVASRSDARPELFSQDASIFDPSVWDITADVGVASAPPNVLRNLTIADVGHISCHGYFDSQDPLSSGLLLSNQSELPPRNPKGLSVEERRRYVLSARELLEARVNAQLVTLRACSTGIQSVRNHGDELDGLTRALLYAGTSAVIVSLWNVDLISSQQLLARFYQYWKGSASPIPKWRALWMAQRHLFASTDELYLRHPYHWAPFVLIGDWE